MSTLGSISHFLSPVSCDSLVLQGLRCECGAGVKFGVIALTLSYLSLEVLMAPHGKELSEDEKNIVAYIKMA